MVTTKIGKLFDGMLLLASLICTTLLGSCDKGIGGNEDPEPGVYDLTVSDFRKYGAMLKAKAVLPEKIATDFEVGFELSKSNTFPKESTRIVFGNGCRLC